MRERTGLILVVACVLALVINALPFFQGEVMTHLRVHDNLDGVVVNYALAAKDGYFVEPTARVSSFPDSISRFSVVYGYDFWLFLFVFLTPFNAYVVGKVIMMLSAIVGMCWLLKECVRSSRNVSLNYWILIFSTLFATLPFWGITNSVSGFPLLLAGIFSMRRGVNLLLSCVVIFFIGISSSLPWVGVFIIPGWFIWIGFLVMSVPRSEVRAVSFGWVVYLIGISIGNWNLLYQVLLAEGFQSHRLAWDLPCEKWWDTFSRWRYMLRFNQYHTKSLHQFLLLPIAVASVLWLRLRNWTKLLGVFMFVFAVSVAAIYRNCDLHGLRAFVESFLPIQWDRLYWFIPGVVYVVGFFALVEIWNYRRFRWVTSGLFLVLIMMRVSEGVEEHEVLLAENNDSPSFREYYSIEGVEKLRELVGQSCIDFSGLSAAVLQMNGICTQGFYLGSYPLSYRTAYVDDLGVLIGEWNGGLDGIVSWGCRLSVPQIPAGELPDWKGWKDYGQLPHDFFLCTGKALNSDGLNLLWEGLYLGQPLRLYQIQDK